MNAEVSVTGTRRRIMVSDRVGIWILGAELMLLLETRP